MKKKWLIAAGILLALIIIAVIVLAMRLDGLITKAINTYGPEITGTEVRVDDVRVSFLSGNATITNFTMGNPKGFRSPRAMKVTSVSVSLEFTSLLTDTVVIRHLEIVEPEITYEKRGGTDNFKAIATHAEQKAKEKRIVSAETGEKKPGKKLLIREFIVKSARVTLHTPDLPSGAASAVIPDMHLRNVGGKDGAPPEKVFSQVLSALHDRLTTPIVVDALKRSLLDARKTAEMGTRSLTEKIKGILK
jgi:uncharacterized protein involved in outer membrane biogenesis